MFLCPTAASKRFQRRLLVEEAPDICPHLQPLLPRCAPGIRPGAWTQRQDARSSFFGAACEHTHTDTRTHVSGVGHVSHVAGQGVGGGGFHQPPPGAGTLSLTFLYSISESTRATVMMDHNLTSARDQGRGPGGAGGG